MNDAPLRTALPMAFVPTVKAEEAKNFYSEVLGMDFVLEDMFALIFRVNGNLSFRLQKVGEFSPQPFTVCGWEVSDIEKTVLELGNRGVKFEVFGFPNQAKTGVCTFENGDKVAWFKDPDGNTLSIAQLVH